MDQKKLLKLLRAKFRCMDGMGEGYYKAMTDVCVELTQIIDDGFIRIPMEDIGKYWEDEGND